MFRNRDYPASLLNGTSFMKLVFSTNSLEKAQMWYGMSVPTAFEAQLAFHALVLLSQKLSLRKLSILQYTASGMLAGMDIQLV